MRTIALEEHFLMPGYRTISTDQATRRSASGQAGSQEREQSRVTFPEDKLFDLGTGRLQDMDASGIDLQVLSHTLLDPEHLDGNKAVSFAQQANDQLAAAIAAHPDRFAGFALLPIGKPEAAVRELERAMRLPGFKGVMIHGMTNGRFLDDPVFQPVLEQAATLDVPIYLHPAIPPQAVRETYYAGLDQAASFVLGTSGWGWHSEVGLHVLRLILSSVFDRLPDLHIIIGHMGEMLPFMLGRIDNVLTPVAKHLQRPVPEYILNNIFITTSGFFTNPPLTLAIQIMGIDHILFSVDYPYSSNAQGRAFLDNLSLNEEDKEKLCHLNAERILKLT